MNELLNIFTHNYPNYPILSTFVLICSIWYISIASLQFLNWAMAWIDDSKRIKNNQIITKFGLLLDKKHKPRDNDVVGSIIFTTVAFFSSVAINFWWISIWFILFGTVMFSLRGGRRVQKKLTAHIANKDAHNGNKGE